MEAQASGIPCICSEKITKEADKTGLLRFLPLGSPKLKRVIIVDIEKNWKLSPIQSLEISSISVEDYYKANYPEYKIIKIRKKNLYYYYF